MKAIVIGAGVIGCLIARELTIYGCSVQLIEKENDVGNGITAANSAIIHCGHDPKPNTLKAKLNVEGSRMYEKLCKELNISYHKCGAFVCALNKEDCLVLDTLYQQAIERNIKVERFDGEKARTLEPNLSDEVIEVLSLPDTAIIIPWEVAIASAEEAMMHGLQLHLNEKVQAITKHQNEWIVSTNHNIYHSDIVINAAGHGALSLHEMVTGRKPFEIIPRKGEYFVLDERAKSYVNRVIYPTPSKKGKGVLCLPTVHGNILVGPTAEETTDGEACDTTVNGLEAIRTSIHKMMKNVPFQYIIREYAGVRPTPTTKDFFIEEYKETGFYSLLGIESPGLASAPAIAKYVRKLIAKRFPLQKDETYCHLRKPFVSMRYLDETTRNQYIEKDPDYGVIVCRCRGITKGEIKNCILRHAGARTIKGVKRRVFSGMGNCQGGFCEPHVLKILSECLHQPIESIRYDAEAYPILINRGEQNERD